MEKRYVGTLTYIKTSEKYPVFFFLNVKLVFGLTKIFFLKEFKLFPKYEIFNITILFLI